MPIEDTEPNIDQARPTAEFFNFIKDVKSFYVWIGYGVIISPAITYIVGVASPYPNQSVLCVAASLAAFFSLMFAFQLWFHGRTSKKRRDKLLLIFGLSGLVSLILYIGLYSSFVVVDTAQESKHVVGFALQRDIEIVKFDRSPPLTDRELLENFGGEPEKIWTKLSLTVTRMLLVFGWMAMWFLLTITLGVFLCDAWLRNSRTGVQR